MKRKSVLALIAVSAATAMVLPSTSAFAAAKKKPAAKAKPKPTTAPTTAAAPKVAAPTDGPGCAGQPDTSIDKDAGSNAGWAKWVYDCTDKKPLKASGAPIVIGFQNPEGDPNGSFPEYRTGAQAAEKYINEELGGIGADYAAGKPGRPVKIEVCSVQISPGDNQRCANELAAKKPAAVISTINFFGNHFAVFNAAKIPVIVDTPVTALDFTSPGTYAIGGGGGCLGVHTGLIEYATKDLGKRTIAVPWANTPPGVFCYNDLEKKPLNVLNGTTPAKGNTAALTMPNLKHIGVPILPGQADVTAQAQQVLDFKPDAIVFSAQGADCWTLVNSLGKLGWTPSKIPLVLSGSCIDDQKAKEAGDLAKGIYFVGSTPITQTNALQGLLKQESTIYLAKTAKYGAKDDALKGFATQGFEGIMVVWEMGSLVAKGDASKVTGDSIEKALAATKGAHNFGAPPLDCQAAVAPYISTCQSLVTATVWNGTGYDVKRSNFSGLYLIKGTELDLGR
jgi:branched-chain amino acid transport system substrate-binding protein